MELNPQIEITITDKQTNYVWVQGILESYIFEAKVYCTGSKYGIDEGRVSKFSVWMKPDERGRKRWVANYDRDWDVYPKDEHWPFVCHIIGLLEEMPQPEEVTAGMCFPFD